MLLATVAIVFAVLILFSMPIVFALGVAGIAGLWIGGYPMQQLSSALVSGSQSWVLLAIPSFVFAGSLMERAGMSVALVELGALLVGQRRADAQGRLQLQADRFQRKRSHAPFSRWPDQDGTAVVAVLQERFDDAGVVHKETRLVSAGPRAMRGDLCWRHLYWPPL